ncbi:MAG: hypothetical protein IKN74_00280 [Clostridia bacterium]|nr:hypothetical protein [Clostridia bacterium]
MRREKVTDIIMIFLVVVFFIVLTTPGSMARSLDNSATDHEEIIVYNFPQVYTVKGAVIENVEQIVYKGVTYYAFRTSYMEGQQYAIPTSYSIFETKKLYPGSLVSFSYEKAVFDHSIYYVTDLEFE